MLHNRRYAAFRAVPRRLANVAVVARMRLADAVDEFLVARAPRKDSPHTVAARRRDLAGITRALAEVLGCEPAALGVEDLTAANLRRAFAIWAADRAPATVRRAWSTWNGLCDFLVADGAAAGNPMAAIERPRAPRPTPKPLQGDDTPERLLEAVAASAGRRRDPWPERDLAFLATGLLTGLRLSELLGLDLGSIDGRAGERRLQVRGKGAKERFVPIEEPLELVLERYLASRRARFPTQHLSPHSPLFVDRRGERLRRGGAQYLVRACYRAAGIGSRVPQGALVHALRHTFGTRLAQDGASATEIQRLLGHESLNTSQAYIDSTAREQREAVRVNRTYAVVRRLVAE